MACLTGWVVIASGFLGDTIHGDVDREEAAELRRIAREARRQKLERF